MGNKSFEDIETKARAVEYINKLLKAEGSKEGGNFSSVLETVVDKEGNITIDAQRAEAICILGDNACLKKVSFDMVIAAGADAAVTSAKEIVQGLQNLKSLVKYGMNTRENQSAVIVAGEMGTQVSLELWEKRKVELQTAGRKSEHSSLYNNAAARNAARAKVSEVLKQVDASLHHPVAVVHSGKSIAKSPSASKGG